MSIWFRTHKTKLMRATLAFLCGVLSALALPYWSVLPFFFIGFSGFYILISSAQSFKGGFGLGWSYAFGYYLVGLSWIGNALLVDGNKFMWAWPLAVCALPAGLATFNALACGVAAKYTNLRNLSGFIVFVTLYHLSEAARGTLFTGFPWNLHGMIWSENLAILNAILPHSSIYLLSALTTFWAACIGFAFIHRKPAGVYIVLLSVFSLGTSIYVGANTLSQAQNLETAATRDFEQHITIRIVQPNITQEEKWDRLLMRKHFEKLIKLSASQGNETQTTFIIWPETATSYAFLSDETARQMITQTLSAYAHDAYLITGALLKAADGQGITNSIITLDKNGGIIQRYDKSHLVPFGEYIPFHQYIPIETITKFSGFKRGNGPTILNTPNDIRYSPLICYEIIFPGKAMPASANPDFIVNVTNDGWYGYSAGPFQHFAMARMRAIENKTPVIRAANTGISGVIHETGVILKKSVLQNEEVITSYIYKE